VQQVLVNDKIMVYKNDLKTDKLQVPKSVACVRLAN